MEVTATALLCLNTSSRLSCRENTRSLQTEQLVFVCMSAHASMHLAYLRLGEHIEAPRAHLAIGGNADQVVGVLGSYHVHTVDRVLHTVDTVNAT